jgi:uncharacterized protein HemY
MGTHDCSALVEVLLEVEVILAAPSIFPSSSQKIGVAELEVQPTGILHSLTVRFSVKCLEPILMIALSAIYFIKQQLSTMTNSPRVLWNFYIDDLITGSSTNS